MVNFEGAHVTVIKRFEFAEPVFQPEKLAKSIFSWLPFDRRENYTFLGDAKQIKFLVDHKRAIEISGIGTMRPIRNPYVREEIFWLPFKPSEQLVKLGIRPELPMFPFRITPEIKVSIQKSWLETVLDSKITEQKAYLEMLIYPPGVSTMHLHLAFKSKWVGLNLNGLINLSRKLDAMPLAISKNKRYKKKRYTNYEGVFGVFNLLANQVASRLLSGTAERKEFTGYHVVYTLQGKPVKPTERLDVLAKLFADDQDPHSSHKYIELEGKHEDDILAVGRHTSVIYVDAGIREKHRAQHEPNISEGRRCFRNNFTNSVEFAYVTEALIHIYNSRFNDILNEIDKLPLSATVETIIKMYATRGVLDPCAYGTLRNVILDVPVRLAESRRDHFWTKVYSKVAYGLELSQSLEELKITTDKVYGEAVKYRSEHKERISNLASNINNAIDRIIRLIKAVKTTEF